MKTTRFWQHPYFQVALAVLYVVILSLLSYNRSKKLTMDSDYWVFWNAGKEFATGGDLYITLEGARPYIYPPFAAFTFQNLAILPLTISANIFFLINALILLPLSVVLLLEICRNLGFEPRKIRIPVYLAALCSLKYFWNNLTMFQMNFVIFFLCLAGIFYLSKAKPVLAGIFLAIATMIKIYPVFLLIYTLLYYRRLKVWGSVIGVSLGLLLLPGLLRGFGTYLQDHISYYHTFLQQVQEGLVITTHTNHTLKAFIFKVMHPEVWDQFVYEAAYPTASLLSNILLLLMAVTLVVLAVYQYRKNQSLSLAVLACIFIFTHQVSGITWTAHLVTAMLFYLPLFLVDSRKLPNRLLKGVHWFLIGLAFFLGIEGKDITGEALYLALRHVDIFTLYPIALFAYYACLIFSGKEVYWYKSIPTPVNQELEPVL